MNNPLYIDGEFVWDRFFSYFGWLFALIAFVVIGSIAEANGGTFALVGLAAFTAVFIVIYGFYGMVAWVIALIALGITDSPFFGALGIGFLLALLYWIIIGGFINNAYEPAFHKTFTRWVRAREKPDQKRKI